MKSVQKVAIVGLGYVGLPLLVTVARSGWTAIGIDSDSGKVQGLLEGKSPVEDVDGGEILELLSKSQVTLTSEPQHVAEADVVVFCLPTPVSGEKPDLTILLNAVECYAPYFKDNVLIVSESSSYPGTLRDEIVPICERFRGEKQFSYGHSPERVDPGNKKWTNANTPRIISGMDEKSLVQMREFYGAFCTELIEVESPEIAEAAKMFENTFRQVNIALVNEFSRYCHLAGIPARKVIDAAATKPFGFMKFNYGVGVGGHCIPVDPHYLMQHARRYNINLDIIEVSNRINSEQPRYVLERAKALLNGKLNGKRIVVVGLSYKPNTSDMRESPAIELIQLLKSFDSVVFCFDNLCQVDEIAPMADLGESYDLAIISVRHNDFDYTQLLEKSKLILDCTNSFESNEKIIQL